MLPRYRVLALNTAYLRLDLSGLVYGHPPGTEVTIPVFAVALEGEGHRVLVDTGISDAAWFESSVGDTTWQAPGETLVDGLRHIGWSADDVDIVVNTHFHSDHCGNNRLFQNARIFVAAAEWQHARQPLPSQDNLYAEREFGGVPYLHHTLVTQDHLDVLPGLRIVLTPGHTPGHICVLANTDQGVLCMTGDATNVRENWTQGAPGAILYDTRAAYESMDKIRQLADRILMTHDRDVRPFQDRDFPSVR